MSPCFKRDLKWWQGRIIIKTLKQEGFTLALFNCFLILLPRKGRSIMKQMADGEGEYLPGTFRYNRVGAQNH